MKLSEMIEDCSALMSASGLEFDADEVLECLYRKYPNEMQAHGARLARSEARRYVSTHLKRSAAEDPNEEYEQLTLLGIPRAPKNVVFKNRAGKVSYIGTLSARRIHLESAIRLRDENIKFCVARIADYRQMLDYLKQYEDDITLGEAVERSKEEVGA